MDFVHSFESLPLVILAVFRAVLGPRTKLSIKSN